ncbi:S-formylglutathione hydrolase [Reyranella sp.]|uniref:S-formylglutathione hydrolase n=1 Tax=Reyranella sp. TaxID=1929291 RepID=UPI0025CC4560|nr:S-formylglutathione hydrolase [Reyranella sp.]
MAIVTTRSEQACFGGTIGFYSHASTEIGAEMKFSIFVPPNASPRPRPALYFLAGLTCTEETFMIKANALRHAAELGLVLVAPDTSPRGLGLPGEEDSWDFGTGAGFYLDAEAEPWRRNYRMYSYVTRELPALVEANFPVDAVRRGVFGHSMGGHGALVIALRNPQAYRSASAFAPICNPVDVPWGEKAFGIIDAVSIMDEKIRLIGGLHYRTVQVSNWSGITGLPTPGYDQSAVTPSVSLIVRPWKEVWFYGNFLQALEQGPSQQAAWSSTPIEELLRARRK